MKHKRIIAGIFAVSILFFLTSCDDSGRDKSDDPVTVTMPPAAPGAPVLVAGDRQIQVSWGAVAGADTYQVWFGTSDSSAAAAQYSGDIDNTDTECTISGLDYRSTTYIWICAVNTAGASDFSEPSFATIDPPAAGYSETVTAGGVAFDVVYVRGGFTIPMGTDDSETATIDDDFWIGKTEVTNELVAAVYQWAYDNGKFDTNGDGDVDGDDNASLSDTEIVLYGAYLLYTDEGMGGMIHFDNTAPAGSEFSIVASSENYPCVEITWYGAVMFCNWFTEMIDGSAAEVVYSWSDNGDNYGTAGDDIWQEGETDADESRKGFRLPEKNEWELAARYLGATAPAVGDDLDSERLVTDVDGTDYFWTPGDYASGAAADYTHEAACNEMAWWGFSGTTGIGNADGYQIVATRTGNALGLYDMSGNVNEWTNTLYDNGWIYNPILKGGSWRDEDSDNLRVGDSINHCYASDHNYDIGFRIVRDSY